MLSYQESTFNPPQKNVAYSHISDMLKPRSAVHTLRMQ